MQELEEPLLSQENSVSEMELINSKGDIRLLDVRKIDVGKAVASFLSAAGGNVMGKKWIENLINEENID